MGRQVNEARITTPNARSKLASRKAPYWRAVDRGSHVGYRKGANGGTWVARYRNLDRSYITKAIGAADDRRKADGVDVLDYSEALSKARLWFEDQGNASGLFTIGDALDEYFNWYSQHGKAHVKAKQRADLHILPVFRDVPVGKLNRRDIREWHEALAASPPMVRSSAVGFRNRRPIPTDPEGRRKRKASANKALTILKAALNHAFREREDVKSDDAWRRVKPFRNVDVTSIRYLTQDEALRLVNACDWDFRNLVRAAIYSGCRYGELTSMDARDFNPDAGTLHIRFGKNGRPRHIPLTEEGQIFFSKLTVGRSGGEHMFLRADGKAWRASQQARRLSAACKVAEIEPPVSFHVLRHSYASWLAMRGVSLKVIADVLGHSDTRVTERHYASLSASYLADTIRANLPDLGGVEDRDVVDLRRTDRSA